MRGTDMTDSSKQDASEPEPTGVTEMGEPPFSTINPTGPSAQFAESTPRGLPNKIMYLLEHRAAEAIIGILGIVVAIIIAIVTSNPSLSPDASPTSTTAPTPATPVLVALRNLDIRSGPGSEFDRVGVLAAEDSLDIRGITDDSLWYQVLLANGTYGWVLAAESFGRFEGNRSVLAVVTPTATPTTTPTVTPSPSDTPFPTNTATETVTSTATPTDTPRPSDTPTYTSEPSATVIADLVTLAPSPTLTPAILSYPCDASIKYTQTGLLNIVRGGPSSHSSYRPPIQQGAVIRILSKDPETREVFWYHIADTDGNELGWIEVRYAELSENCPR
ncbi:MAG: hypothetical protein CL610_19885 [Anaerolineaceae bacterium]|nr:hypothetical protein [Anaerolineaceae bacterium]